jgi:hypothetical protein
VAVRLQDRLLVDVVAPRERVAVPGGAVELEHDPRPAPQQVRPQPAPVEQELRVDLGTLDPRPRQHVERQVLERAARRHVAVGEDRPQAGGAAMARRAVDDLGQLSDAHAALGQGAADHPPQRRPGQVGGEIEHRARVTSRGCRRVARRRGAPASATGASVCRRAGGRRRRER